MSRNLAVDLKRGDNLPELTLGFEETMRLKDLVERKDAVDDALSLPSSKSRQPGAKTNLRARTGSVGGVTAIDIEDMAGDE